MRRAAVAALGVAAALAAVACFELSGPSSGLSSISTLEVAWPSVVVGDSLRNADGAAAPLTVQAYDGDGNPVTDAEVAFFALDTGLSVTQTGFVMGERVRTSPAPIVAQVRRGGDVIQTPEVLVYVVPRPDTVSPAGADTLDVKVYTRTGPADTSWIRSDDINVTVRNRALLASPSAAAGVRSWIVRYEITARPSGVNDAVTAFFPGSGAPQVAVDTTNESGVAAAQVILRPVVLPSQAGTHVVKVTATVRERGQNVPGSPIEFVIPFEIRSP